MFEEVFEQIINEFESKPQINKNYKVVTNLKKAEDLIVSPSWCSHLESISGQLGFKIKERFNNKASLISSQYSNKLYESFNENVFKVPEYPIYEAFCYYFKVLYMERLLQSQGVGEEWFRLLRNRAFPCGENTIFAFDDSPLYKQKISWYSKLKPKSKKDKYSEDIESLSAWLSGPNELNETPVKVMFLKSYKRILLLLGQKVKINLFEYQMGNGLKGRGFTGPVTWAFLGEGVGGVNDSNLVLAYCGWLFLTLGSQYKTVITEFNDKEREISFITNKVKHELSTNMKLTAKYKIEDLIYLEFEGNVNGLKVKQAVGNDNSSFYCDENDPEFALPALYFMLGQIQQN